MTDLVTGDTGSLLQVTCTDSRTAAAINLAGATVRLRWTNDAGVVVTKPMTVVSAAAGTAKYQFLAGEIIFPKMTFEVEITDSSGFIISNLALIEMTVREQLA